MSKDIGTIDKILAQLQYNTLLRPGDPKVDRKQALQSIQKTIERDVLGGDWAYETETYNWTPESEAKQELVVAQRQALTNALYSKGEEV